MEVLYEVELKYKRDVNDNMYSWITEDAGMPCPKVKERHDLIGVMLSDVSNLVSIGLRESDIFAHLEANLAIPRVRFNINRNVPMPIIGKLFQLEVTECKVERNKKDRYTLQFKGMREL
jgi:hypothetical protein